VSLYETLLFLHVLAAFFLVAAVVLYTYLIAASLGANRPADVARTLGLVRVGDALSGVGMLGTLAFGIALAIQVDGYELWNGWIIAALVLWLAAGGTGDRSSRHYIRVRRRAEALLAEGRDGPSSELAELVRDPRALAVHGLLVLFLLLLLIDMIWKPGA
jgi:uncharacterized membrane protein